MKLELRHVTRALLGSGAGLVLLVAGACWAKPGDETAAGAAAAPEAAKAEAAAPEAAKAEAAAPEADAVVVTVDGTELTQGEVDKQIMQMLASRGVQNIPPEQMAQFRPRIQQNIVQNFVANTVLRNEAKRQKIEAPKDEVEKALEDIRQRAPAGMDFATLLQQAGMTEEQLREDVTDSLRVRALLEKETEGNTAVTDDEMKAYYEKSKAQYEEPEQVTARHILLKVDEGADDAAKAEKLKAAEAIRKQLVDGTDFATVAKEKSDCPSSAQGGNLGTFTRGRMVKEFEDAAFKQKVDEIGPVVETKFGYHIIQVTEHTDAGQKTFEEVKDRIADELKDSKRREVVKAYIDGLEKAADIKYAD